MNVQIISGLPGAYPEVIRSADPKVIKIMDIMKRRLDYAVSTMRK